jgi:2-oxo-4-hydroxy-4-carboxy-5-ureidoimidazoline decarboxylase
MTTLTLDGLDATDHASFVAALGDIFEHSPWVAEAAFLARPFDSLQALHAAMVAAVKASPPEHQRALLAAHPDLAGKAARAGDLTAASTAEQASAGLDRLTEAEYAAFHRLNDAYRETFGIPFIVCVRRHTKGSILRLFERRLANDATAEHATALDEVFRIAALRLDQRVQAADRLPLSGRLSTHVLDTHGGSPAKGVPIALWELGPGDARRLVMKAQTNRDGRTDQPLIGGRPVPIGTYELVFEVGAYFAARGVPLADPPFLDVVPIRFSVAEAEGHYHVPLLVTPWSFATYRGS